MLETYILDCNPLEKHNSPSSVPSGQVLSACIKLNRRDDVRCMCRMGLSTPQYGACDLHLRMEHKRAWSLMHHVSFWCVMQGGAASISIGSFTRSVHHAPKSYDMFLSQHSCPER